MKLYFSTKQNVWIPGQVIQNFKNGKFKACLKDKYGDEVNLSDS